VGMGLGGGSKCKSKGGDGGVKREMQE